MAFSYRHLRWRSLATIDAGAPSSKRTSTCALLVGNGAGRGGTAEQFKFEDPAPQSPESLASRDFSASGLSSRNGTTVADLESRLEDAQVDQVESTRRRFLRTTRRRGLCWGGLSTREGISMLLSR